MQISCIYLTENKVFDKKFTKNNNPAVLSQNFDVGHATAVTSAIPLQ